MAPLPNCFIGQRAAAFRQQLFHFAEAQTDAVVQPHRIANNVSGKPMALRADRIGHHQPVCQNGVNLTIPLRGLGGSKVTYLLDKKTISFAGEAVNNFIHYFDF